MEQIRRAFKTWIGPVALKKKTGKNSPPRRVVHYIVYSYNRRRRLPIIWLCLSKWNERKRTSAHQFCIRRIHIYIYT